MEPKSGDDNQNKPDSYRTFSARLRRDVPSNGVDNQPDEFVLTDVAAQRLREYLENRILERGPGMETLHREMQGAWPAPTDDQVDAMRLAVEALNRSGRSPLQTLPSGVTVAPVNNWSFDTTYSRYLGNFVLLLLEARPDHARKCEDDDRLWDLAAAFRCNHIERWRLGIIADNLEDNGYPSDDIRLVIMRKQPELWQTPWWPTCLRKDGDK
jgi:hypothetical protein